MWELYDRDKILVNDFYQTNIPGYYAIGDVTPGLPLRTLLLPKAFYVSKKLPDAHVEAIDYGNIPGCTYCTP